MDTLKYPRLADGHIRLVTLHAGSDETMSCSLQTADPCDLPSYEALSYAWGDGARTTMLTCNESVLRITHSLYVALQYLRSAESSRLVWIDQICIDQENKAEKSTQISKMASIYRNAQRVLVWLGEEDETTDLVFDNIRALAVRATRHGLSDRGQSELLAAGGYTQETIRHLQLTTSTAPEWVAYRSLLARAWFCRVWVFEEVVLARDIRLLCGRKNISWEEFMVVYGTLSTVGRIIPSSPPYLLDDRGVVPIVFFNRQVRSGVYGPERMEEVHDLLSLVKALRRNSTQEPRDRIYGVLGVASDLDDRTPVVDVDAHYTRVYSDFTKWFILRYMDLSVLKLVDVTPRSNQGREESGAGTLPSWAPNYHQYDHYASLLVEMGPKIFSHGLARMYSATGAFETRLCNENSSQLGLKGIYIGTINEISEPAGNLNMTTNIAIGPRVLTGGEWFDLASRRFSDGLYRHTNEPLAYAYARTRAGDHIPGEQSSSDRRARVATMKAQGCPMHLLEPGPVSFRDGVIYSAPGDIANSIIRHTTRRRFYLTNTDYMGTCHGSCRVGDHVYLLLGGDMPFVIRGLDSGCFQFKGESYVHGCMDGEYLLKVRKPASASERSTNEQNSIAEMRDDASLETKDIILL